MLSNAREQLAAEFAVVLGTTPEEAMERIVETVAAGAEAGV
jgi:RNA polymerase-interacting CarD/CdnL/TRCF family regulator